MFLFQWLTGEQAILAAIFFILSIPFHFLSDWLLQTEKMALNKDSMWKIPAIQHAATYFICMMFVFPFWIALALGVLHLWIDTRKPIMWLCKVFKKGTDFMLLIWYDQALHIVLLFIAAIIAAITMVRG